MKKLLMIVAAGFMLTACNNQKQEAKQETVTEANPKTVADNSASSSQQAKVFFVLPQNGEIVTSPFKVKMGVSGMEVQPAGEMKEGMGHHHIIINGTHIEEGKVVPADEQHIHFGAGQTETELDLKPGKYTLTMQFADGVHKSYGENMSTTINIEVQ
jgi:hypothetical protein